MIVAWYGLSGTPKIGGLCLEIGGLWLMYEMFWS